MPVVIFAAVGFGPVALDVILAIRLGAFFLSAGESVRQMDVGPVIAIDHDDRSSVAERSIGRACRPAVLIHSSTADGSQDRGSPKRIATAHCGVTSNITIGAHTQLQESSTAGHGSSSADDVSPAHLAGSR